ncbi:hypothetical protein [Amycolatopsis aidingensis]|uniref:hypothetical protein n=1 Tax=Amycolatopsis aidingensis TaxID=2842453 RepID=UPI001E37773B|nr:hypothetical protein [Amycolatopsis aidingensis]
MTKFVSDDLFLMQFGRILVVDNDIDAPQGDPDADRTATWHTVRNQLQRPPPISGYILAERIDTPRLGHTDLPQESSDAPT